MSTNKPVLSQAVWLSAAVTEFECCLLRLTVSSSCFHILWNMINPPACDLYVCWGRGLYFTHTTDSVLKIMTEMISKTFRFYSLIAWLIARVFYCICSMTLQMWCNIYVIWQSNAMLEQGCNWVWHWMCWAIADYHLNSLEWLRPKCNIITQAWQSFTSFSYASELRFCNVFIGDPSAPYCGELCRWGLDIHFPCKWWLILFAR